MKRASKTALFNAAKKWNAAAVRTILDEAAALVSATDTNGRAAPHVACAVKPGADTLLEPNGIDTVTALLDGGADLEREVPTNEEGFRATALWFVVARGANLPLAEFLVRRGADASYCLWAAVWQDDAAMVRSLLKADPHLNFVAHGETPIFYAARLQRLNALNVLIDAGADPSITDPKGRDAVDIARARRLPTGVVDRLTALKNRHHADRT